MAVDKWIGGSGQGLTWGDAFSTATLNSIGAFNAILSDIAITNGTPFDIFADISISLASLAVVTPNFVGVYLYPLNKDGTTYGDGRFVTNNAGPPPDVYSVGSIGLVAATQAQEGTLTQITIPPGTFKFVLYNACGNAVAFAASGNTCQYRTYNRAII